MGMTHNPGFVAYVESTTRLLSRETLLTDQTWWLVLQLQRQTDRRARHKKQHELTALSIQVVGISAPLFRVHRSAF